MNGLMWNPWLEVVPLRRGPQIVEVAFLAPLRGRPPRWRGVRADGDPGVFKLLVGLAGGSAPTDLVPAEWEFAVEAGLLVRGDQVTATVRFSNPLPEAAPPPPPAPLVVHPGLHLQRRNQPPPPAMAMGAFAPAAMLAWLETASASIPIWIDAAQSAEVARLSPGAPEPADLPGALRAALAAAGILDEYGAAERRHAAWQERVAEAAGNYRQHGYAILPGLLPPLAVWASARYFRALVAEGRVRLGDPQVALRFSQPNDPLARFWHLQFAALVSQIAGEAIKPSYCYLARYQPGATLDKHTDRPQCEHSLTMLFDYSPPPDGASPWPLYLELPGRVVELRQPIGDALLYRGRELPHYRHALAEGHSSTSVFFHYVAADFAGPLH